MKRMLVFGYLHVTFPINVICQLAKSQLVHTTKIKDNKLAFGFRDSNHIPILPKLSTTGGTYFTFNFVLIPIKEKSDCSVYPPAELSTVKTKIWQCVM